ncbi:Melanopsin-B [Trichoplax sp. H2]|nr:Melanopsin-B [Trichoplax sp. H2]|eukprot:RDD42734.1 Melanopsin-B [Trichoplax sp. H2]
MNNTSGSNATANPETASHPFISLQSHVPFIAYVILLIATVVGNCMVIAAFFINRSLRTIFNSLLFNLALVDLFAGIFRIGFITLSLGTIHNGSWPYGPTLCNINGLVHSVAFSANVHTLMTIAIFRYLVVVRYRKDWITRNTVIVVISLIWIYSLLLGFLPIIGWNRYHYQPYEYTCLPDWYRGKSYSIFLTIADFLIPMLVLCYCYLAIYNFIKKNSQRIRAFSINGNEAALQQIIHRETKVTQAMFIIFITFVACVAPYAICIFIMLSIFHIWVGAHVAFFCGYMVNLNSAINPILYAIFYKHFRASFYRLCCIAHRRASMIRGNRRILISNKVYATTTNGNQTCPIMRSTIRSTIRSKTTETLLQTAH